MIYFSLDIETTGLNPALSQVLEIAIVAEDTFIESLPPVEELPAMRAVIGRRRTELHGSPDAFRMHEENGLLQEVATSSLTEDKAWESARSFIAGIQPIGKRPVLAGKNVAGFDLRFAPSWFREFCHHRVIDVGSVAMGADKTWWSLGVPSLLELEPTVRDKHRALDDAMAVVEALRRLTGRYQHGPIFTKETP